MENNNPHFEKNPMFPNTTIFLGNGFDLSLGLKSRYTDFFNHKGENGDKDFWPVHSVVNESDQLYTRLNGPRYFNRDKAMNADSTWYDLEAVFKEHAKRKSPQGVEHVCNFEASFEADQAYYEEIKAGLINYLKYEVDRW